MSLSSPPAQTSNHSLYSFDDKGWRSYNIDKLDKSQCGVVSEDCASDAMFTRFKMVAIVAGFSMALTGAGFTTFAVGKISAALFVAIVGKVGVLAGASPAPAVFFMAKTFAVGLTYIISLVAVRKLWDTGKAMILNHWNYAAHLDQQSTDAKLRKASFEAPAATP